MIGFILGTSEGKKILGEINKYTSDIAVSTATSYGGQLLENYKIKDLNTRPLNKEEMKEWMKKNELKMIIDGSHPYASEVSKNAIECAKELNIEYVRYERLGILEKIDSEDIIRFQTYEEAIEYIKTVDGNVLNTTGGNNVAKFIDIDFSYRVIHRILPSPAVLKKIVDAGIKIKDIIAMQGPITYELEMGFIKQFDIKCILTKDSGAEGGVLEKYKACKDSNIKILVIEKPKMEYNLAFNDIESLVDYIKSRI